MFIKLNVKPNTFFQDYKAKQITLIIITITIGCSFKLFQTNDKLLLLILSYLMLTKFMPVFDDISLNLCGR